MADLPWWKLVIAALAGAYIGAWLTAGGRALLALGLAILFIVVGLAIVGPTALGGLIFGDNFRDSRKR